MKAQAHDKSTAVWLLNLANDMRKAKNDKTLDDLPVSIPQDANRCIIANAFNYGCNVDPDSGMITFKTQEDRDTYLKVMDIDSETSDDLYIGIDEISEEDYNEWNTVYCTTEAPMTAQLIDIAQLFDTGELFAEYSEYGSNNVKETY